MPTIDLSARMALAAAEDTPSEVLEKLAKDSEIEVRRAVAGNPNAPIDALLELGAEFPDSITANPIFYLQLVAEPESRFVRLSLARSLATPEKVLAKLSQIPDAEILCAIARNTATPASTLENIVFNTPKFDSSDDDDAYESDRLFSLIAKNPNSSAELIAHLATLDGCDKFVLAKNPKTPVAFLNEFATWQNLRMHRALLCNPAVPASVLETLAGEDNEEIRTAVKSHHRVSQTAIDICNFIEGKPGTPDSILEKLASDRRDSVRHLVAQNLRTPAPALKILAQDLRPEVCFELVTNPNLTAEILGETAKQLVKEYAKWLESRNRVDNRWQSAFLAIVRHPRVTPAILECLADLTALAKCDASEVLFAIARHHLTNEPAFAKIARYFQNRSDNAIYIAFGSNPNVPAAALEILIEGFFSGNVAISLTDASYVISHSNFPTRLLEKITASGKIPLLELVARHPNTPIHLINAFARDSERYLRPSVARNPSAPIELLRELATDSDRRVRSALAANPIPLEIAERLAEDAEVAVRAELASNERIHASILKRLALDPDEYVQIAILRNPQAPTSIVDSFADRSAPLVRELVAQHPNSSAGVTLKLWQDAVENRTLLNSVLRKFDKFFTEELSSLAEYVFREIVVAMAKSNADGELFAYTCILLSLATYPDSPTWIWERFVANEPQEIYNREPGGQEFFQHLRKCLAENPKTPTFMLEKIVAESVSERNEVRQIAIAALRQRG